MTRRSFFATAALASTPTLAASKPRRLVRFETKRIVDIVQGKCAVVPGIGVDVPDTSAGAPNGGKRPSDQAALRSAITNAFSVGASGILISREYDEMRLESLRTVGQTLRELGKV